MRWVGGISVLLISFGPASSDPVTDGLRRGPDASNQDFDITM